MTANRQPWIYSAGVDGLFILAPALAITGLVLIFHRAIETTDSVPIWLWGVLIVGVDVAHVYSTLFRTYADGEELRARAGLYTLVPVICWVAGTLIYSISAVWFWRCLAYLAVFHFVRQQYGFMMIYARRERESQLFRLIDQAAIYLATVYPLVYWHTHWPRNFDWFVENDFIALPWAGLNEIALAFYVLVLAIYVIKETINSYRSGAINIPKNLLLLGTAVSWFVGIVAFDNDLAFTATNVIAHGVPYMALIWIYGHNRGETDPGSTIVRGLSVKRFFSLKMLPVYVGVLVALAYLEEGLWDGFIWTENGTLFQVFRALPPIDDDAFVAWLVPFLALPQMVHYVLDAFIWRLHQPNMAWKETLFYRVRTA